MLNQTFLPASLYRGDVMHQWDIHTYANHYWHPVAATSHLQPGEVLAITMLDQPLLLTWPTGEHPRAFRNRCPHRGVALRQGGGTGQSCRRLVCPYHGWTYNLRGELLAAAREADFGQDFDRQGWGLQELACRIDGPLIWIALSDQALTLEEQLQLVHTEAGAAWNTASTLLRQSRSSLACNWKIAHDNTLDDYHVAIAHPTTLHREQGPVRDYRYRFSQHNNLLETPHPDGGRFLTFGLPPWSHLLVWPDGRLAWLEFMPDRPDCCTMQLHLFASSDAMDSATADAWLRQLLTFLEEDKALVESAQRGYEDDFKPGPPHRLERRILHWQGLYRERLGSDGMINVERSQSTMSALIESTSATGSAAKGCSGM